MKETWQAVDRDISGKDNDLGADAILVHPPGAFRDRDDRDRLILEYHATIAEVGLPLILFYLYEAAGGISYSPELLTTLLRTAEVLGIKVRHGCFLSFIDGVYVYV